MWRWMGICSFVLVASVWQVAAADKGTDLDKLQGKWEVAELVEDGKVIPRSAIEEWLPSGGKFQIEENAVVFVSPHDGKKHVRLFALDQTQNPKGIELQTKSRKDAVGIYRIDGEQVVLCLIDPLDGERPTEFHSKAGSNCILMTLQRPGAKRPATEPKADEPKSVKLLTDAEASKLLVGVWKYSDSIGALILTVEETGAFHTTREMQEIRLFQKVFVQSSVSAGKWSIKNGTITFHDTGSVHRDKVDDKFQFSLRSINEKEMLFVDFLGHAGRAVKMK